MNDSQNRDIEKRARALEMLAKRYDQAGKIREARDIRADDLDTEEGIAVDTIIAALTPPDGYVAAPEDPSLAMTAAGQLFGLTPNQACSVYQSMLAARPEVSP